MGIYLVTGGAGFIGSHIVEYLYQNSEKIKIIDNFSTGKWENIEKFKSTNVEIIKADISHKHQLKGIMKDVEVVFHLAAVPSVIKSVKNPKATYQSNVIGTLNILLEAKDSKVRKFIYTSSSSIYGNTPELPVKEAAEKNPISPYGASKLAGEHLCNVFHKVYGMNIICLRYFNVFGPRQNPKSQYAAVIPNFIDKMLHGKRPIIYGDGGQTRDFTYVYNVVNANILASKTENANGKTFNIACSHAHSIKELLTMLNAIMGTHLQARNAPERQGDIKHSYADTTYAQQLLGFACQISFEDGLKKTVNYFRTKAT